MLLGSPVRVCPFIVPLQNLVLLQPSLRPSLDKEKTNVSVQKGTVIKPPNQTCVEARTRKTEVLDGHLHSATCVDDILIYFVVRAGKSMCVCYREADGCILYKIEHFLLLPLFRVNRAARVALSKTSRTPWLVLAEHSRYL